MLRNTFACLSLSLLFSTTEAQYTINDVYADLAQCDTMARGVFIIWWDSDFDYSAEADAMLDTMAVYRDVCLNQLGMMDPLSPQDGYYCNIYIHTPGEPNDLFAQNGWWNGVSSDSNGYPFMALPNFVLGDWFNLAHETFHIFQSQGWTLTPGFDYVGDAQWYTEAMAHWFAAQRYPDGLYSFDEAQILARLPQVPLWLGWVNPPAGYPDNWQRQVHQYALGFFFYYLTEVEGVPSQTLTTGFFSGTAQVPQQYLFDQLGGPVLRNHFMDWAAHVMNDLDYLQPAQVAISQQEWDTYADPLDDNKFVETYLDAGSNGWYRPADERTTAGWSFNTYRVLNSATETYVFELNADALGNYGSGSYFQGKVLVRNSVSGTTFHDLNMVNGQQGSLSLSVTPNDTALYFVVASMPEVFEDSNADFQLFPYEVRISKGGAIGIAEVDTRTPRMELARCNMLGQQVIERQEGVQFVQYSDGTVRKVFVARSH